MQSKNFIDFIVDAGLDNPDLAKEFAKQMRGVQSEKELQTFLETKGYTLSLDDCKKMLRFTPDKDGNLPHGVAIPMY
jgi:hypothetical protein